MTIWLRLDGLGGMGSCWITEPKTREFSHMTPSRGTPQYSEKAVMVPVSLPVKQP
jgi:hypothetical protein